MTTKLLRQVAEQDQAELAAQHNGETKQPRRIWAVEAMKPTLHEREFEAAQRAVRECIMSFPGAAVRLDRVDAAWSDAGIANRTDAGHALGGLRQGVSKRCKAKCAQNMVDWIVQLYTLQDMAAELKFWRSMGAGREPIPDTRPVRRIVQHVLIGMADYYDDCDTGLANWKAA